MTVSVALPAGKKLALNGQAYEVIRPATVEVKEVETKAQKCRQLKLVCPTGCIVDKRVENGEQVGTGNVYTLRLTAAILNHPKFGAPFCPACGERLVRADSE